jgi:catechol 2,3-dioxygenase-like lactoylglutathione lyase family enzyme
VDGASLVAFLATSDLDASRRFFDEVLGVRPVQTTDLANLYVIDGTQLRVTLVPETMQAPYTVLGWVVPDVVEAVESLRRRGAEFLRYEGMTQDEHDVWTAPGGSRIAWFGDPDGNVLSLQEPPRPAA